MKKDGTDKRVKTATPEIIDISSTKEASSDDDTSAGDLDDEPIKTNKPDHSEPTFAPKGPQLKLILPERRD